MQQLQRFLIVLIIVVASSVPVLAQSQKAADLFQQSKSLLAEKDYKGAKEAIDAALRLFPDNQHILIQAAEVCYQSKDYAESLRYYARLIQLAPQNGGYYPRYIYTLARTQDYERARQYAQMVLERGPQWVGDASNYESVKQIANRLKN